MPAAVHASDAIDTRVSFTVADDDIMRGPEETPTGSPSIPNFQPTRANRLFFDDFERRDSGFENLTHFVLYAKAPGYFEGITTEASLVLRAMVLQDGEVLLRDDGSFIQITGDLGEGSAWKLTAFPVSANRFQLGYSYDIAWGGNQIFQNVRAAPGVRLEWAGDLGYTFIGAKTALGQLAKDDGTVERDTVYGLLAGAGINILRELRLEANGGYFHRGTIDKQELRLPVNGRINTARWDAMGGSAQITYHVGMPIGTPIDFRLYRNDPLMREVFFAPEVYDGSTSFLLQSEVSVLGQTLQDPDRPTSTKVQPAVAADLTFRMKTGNTRVHALAVYRTLSFVLFNVPSNPSFVDFPDGLVAAPEFFFSAGIDYFFESWRLTPGFIAGVQMPSHLTTATPAGNHPPESLGQQTLVFPEARNPRNTEILDPGQRVKPIIASKLTLRWDLSSILSAMGELQGSFNPNRREYAQDPRGIVVRLPADPWIFGFAMMLQARF